MPLNAFKRAARFFMADGGSIKARVLRSGMWVALASSFGMVVNLVRSVILARLLTPEIFGLMGLASIAIRALETVSRPGVAQALIARQKDFDEAAPTAFTLLVGRGLVLAILMAAVAPWVARFYDAEELRPVLQVLSVTFVIGSFVNINTISRQRELDFRQLTYIGQVTMIAGTVVTIAAAYWLRSVWALVIGQVVSVSINVLVSYWFIGGCMRFAFDREIAAELIRYGKFVTGSSIVLYVATELDSAVLGKLMGTEQLGFYTMAATIANLATTNLSKMASSIMMPAYSKLQVDRAALRQAFTRTLSLVMFAVLPASAGLLIAAQPIVQVVLGGQWLPAAVPLQILAVFGLFRSLAAFNGYLFEGIGLPRIAFYLGVLRLAVIVPLIVPATLNYGLEGAAATVTLGIVVQWFGGLVFLRKFVEIGPTRVLEATWRPMWTTALMCGVVYLVMTAVGGSSVSGLALTVSAGIVTYLLLNVPVLAALRMERLG